MAKVVKTTFEKEQQEKREAFLRLTALSTVGTGPESKIENAEAGSQLFI